MTQELGPEASKSQALGEVPAGRDVDACGTPGFVVVVGVAAAAVDDSDGVDVEAGQPTENAEVEVVPRTEAAMHAHAGKGRDALPTGHSAAAAVAERVQ